MVIIRNGDIEMGITMLSEQSRPILKEAAKHRYFSPDSKRRRLAMHKKTKDNKGRRR